MKTYEQERDDEHNRLYEIYGVSDEIAKKLADWANARAEKVIAENKQTMRDLSNGMLEQEKRHNKKLAFRDGMIEKVYEKIKTYCDDDGFECGYLVYEVLTELEEWKKTK